MRGYFAYIPALIIVIQLSSCSIQKRVYRKGYHIVWNNSKSKSDNNTSIARSEKNKPVETEESKLIVGANEVVDNGVITLKKAKLFTFDRDTCGDIIYLKNGEKLVTKISEITEREIKYKRCDYLDGPNFIIKKSSVALIQYVNGVKETIDVQEEVKQPVYTGPTLQPMQMQGQELNGAGLAAFICAMSGLLLIIPLIAAIPLGIVSLSQFHKYPNRYKDKWMPRTALGIIAGLFILTGMIIAVFGFSFSDPQTMGIGGAVAALGVLCLLSILILD